MTIAQMIIERARRNRGGAWILAAQPLLELINYGNIAQPAMELHRRTNERMRGVLHIKRVQLLMDAQLTYLIMANKFDAFRYT